MTNKEMREIIKDHIYDFSSKKTQYEAWFVCDEIISHPNEDYCMLFNDRHIEKYIYSKDNYMTEKENQELKRLVNILNIYGDKYKGSDGFLNFDAEKVYNDPEWESIRLQAQKLYNLLEKEEGIENLKFTEDWKY